MNIVNTVEYKNKFDCLRFVKTWKLIKKLIERSKEKSKENKHVKLIYFIYFIKKILKEIIFLVIIILVLYGSNECFTQEIIGILLYMLNI